MEYYIKPQEWEQLFSVLVGIKGIHKKDEGRLRLFMEAIWYVARSGCQWRLLPSHYGNWRSVHWRFKDWGDRGLWQKIFEALQDPDMEQVMIDGTIVRAHACAAGYGKNSQSIQSLGRSKGGFTTKIHALVDALGNPLKFLLSPGQRNEITQAEALTKGFQNTVLIADKGYDSNAFVQTLQNNNNNVVIPSRSNRKIPRPYDQHLYKERHLIECFFGKIKHFRRVFSRYDKAGSTFLAFLHFVGAFIWLR